MTHPIGEGRSPQHDGRADARRHGLRWLIGSVLVVLITVGVPQRAFAAGVVGTGTPGSCTETALDAALAGGGLVTFDCGAEPVTITITGQKVITSDTIVDGGGLVTLSGGNRTGVLEVGEGAALDLQDLTIANGFRDHGGGIRNDGTLAVTNCLVSGNSAGFGAGIANAGTATLTNSVLTGNSHSGWGCTPVCVGAGINNSGTLRVSNSSIFANGGQHGGGVAVGGGIYTGAPSGALTVTNSTVANNRGDEAGGIAIWGGVATVKNSTVTGNGASGISNGSEKVLGPVPGAITVANSILANSGGPTCFGEIVDGGHNLQWPGSSCGETIPSLDPLLDPTGLKDNGGPTQTIALLSGSPAINAGDPEVCATPPVNGVDQRGYVRPGTGSANCAIGAYEYNSPGPSALCAGDCNGDGAVRIDELIMMVRMALEESGLAGCHAGDTNDDNAITIDEILRAVGVALDGCQLGALPWQPGPYGVGRRRMTFTKPSVTHPDDPRALDTFIWYPADPVSAPAPRFPSGKPNAPLAADAQHLPLMLFSHGSCGLNAGSLYLTTALASHGFVVAAPSHPGNVLGESTCGDADAIADTVVNRPADASFVIDELLALNDDPESFFHGAIDAARIGITGHSAGGYTALRVSALDERVRAGLALAPARIDQPPWGGPETEAEVAAIVVPMMLQGGDLDMITPFDASSRHPYDLLRAPRYLLQIFDTGHFAFSDLCVANRACGEPTTLTQDEAHRITLRYAVPFLLRYVAGDRRFDAYLAPAPGVVFTADTGNDGGSP